jgi:LPXTG-motif cell wall-anchored protein
MEWVTTAPLGDSPLTPVAVMMAIWAGGFVIAALIWWLFGKKKNDAQPGA